MSATTPCRRYCDTAWYSTRSAITAATSARLASAGSSAAWRINRSNRLFWTSARTPPLVSDHGRTVEPREPPPVREQLGDGERAEARARQHLERVGGGDGGQPLRELDLLLRAHVRRGLGQLRKIAADELQELLVVDRLQLEHQALPRGPAHGLLVQVGLAEGAAARLD